MVLARKDGLIYRNVKDGKTGQLWFFLEMISGIEPRIFWAEMGLLRNRSVFSIGQLRIAEIGPWGPMGTHWDGQWLKPCWCMMIRGLPGLVNVDILRTGKIHHFSWDNPLFQWPFSIANC